MEFVKMHGLGNDFVFVDNMDGRYDNIDHSAAALKVCHRRTGIGADGLVFVCPSDKADLRMRIFNSDGSEAEMCGNAVRCFARYALDRKLVSGPGVDVETLFGIMKITVSGEGESRLYRVDMGVPFENKPDIPMTGDGTCALETLTAEGRDFTFSACLLGVPHLMVKVDDVSDADVMKYGPVIETMKLFPRKANVNFTRVDDSGNITVRTWERGCGATYACGTGSSSAAFLCHRDGLTDSTVTVHLALGDLVIECADNGHVFMNGPAAVAYTGDIEL